MHPFCQNPLSFSFVNPLKGCSWRSWIYLQPVESINHGVFVVETVRNSSANPYVAIILVPNISPHLERKIFQCRYSWKIRPLQQTPFRSPALAGVTAVTVAPRGIVSRTPWVVPCSIELDSCPVFNNVVVIIINISSNDNSRSSTITMAAADWGEEEFCWASQRALVQGHNYPCHSCLDCKALAAVMCNDLLCFLMFASSLCL